MYGDPSGCIIAVTRASRQHNFPLLLGRLDLTSVGRRPISPLLEAGPLSYLKTLGLRPRAHLWRRNVAVERNLALADANVCVEREVLSLPTLDGSFEKSLKWVIPELRRRGYDIHSLIF